MEKVIGVNRIYLTVAQRDRTPAPNGIVHLNSTALGGLCIHIHLSEVRHDSPVNPDHGCGAIPNLAVSRKYRRSLGVHITGTAFAHTNKARITAAFRQTRLLIGAANTEAAIATNRLTITDVARTTHFTGFTAGAYAARAGGAFIAKPRTTWLSQVSARYALRDGAVGARRKARVATHTALAVETDWNAVIRVRAGLTAQTALGNGAVGNANPVAGMLGFAAVQQTLMAVARQVNATRATGPTTTVGTTSLAIAIGDTGSRACSFRRTVRGQPRTSAARAATPVTTALLAGAVGYTGNHALAG